MVSHSNMSLFKDAFPETVFHFMVSEVFCKVTSKSISSSLLFTYGSDDGYTGSSEDAGTGEVKGKAPATQQTNKS